MQEPMNPYAPPQAATDTPPFADLQDDARRGAYYAVSPLKVVLYSLATVGIFELYWLYKQWKAVRAQTGWDVSPFWRMWFSIFYTGSLFSRIRLDAAEVGVAGTTSTGALNAVFIICSLIGGLTSRLSGAVGSVWFLSFLSVVPLAIMQGEINRYLARITPGRDLNAGFGVGGVLLVVTGALLWILVIAGTFMAP
jgi:hypothetical protein